MRWWGELKKVLMRSVHTSHACNFEDMWKWKSAKPTTSQKSYLRLWKRFRLHFTRSCYYSGGSRGGARRAWSPRLLFLDQTDARRAEKHLFGRPPPPPPYLWVWMTASSHPPPPPPPLSQGLDPTPYYINKSWYYNLSVLTHEYLADPKRYWFIGIQNGSNIICVI